MSLNISKEKCDDFHGLMDHPMIYLGFIPNLVFGLIGLVGNNILLEQLYHVSTITVCLLYRNPTLIQSLIEKIDNYITGQHCNNTKSAYNKQRGH